MAFTMFEKLPPELRCMVWRYALEYPPDSVYITSVGTQETIFRHPRLPGVFHACRESRYEAISKAKAHNFLHTFQPKRNTEAVLFFDPPYAEIVIEGNVNDPSVDQCDNSGSSPYMAKISAIFKRRIHPKTMASIRYIEVRYPRYYKQYPDFDAYYDRDMLAGVLSKALLGFKDLQRLGVVVFAHEKSRFYYADRREEHLFDIPPRRQYFRRPDLRINWSALGADIERSKA